jgi:hypothetical protein
MSAIADFTDYKARAASPSQMFDIAKSFTIASGTDWTSAWLGTGAPPVGAAPSGAASICNRATTGALAQTNPSGELWALLRRFELAPATVGITSAAIMVIDRLAHKGGLDGTLNTAQTVSTPALTRYTSGVGVRAAIEIYTSIGATGTTATMAYDGDSGTGHTSQPIVVGGAGFSNLGRFLPMSVAAGDSGVKAVSTVTLAASTATAGNFGVTLYKPLLLMNVGLGSNDWGTKEDALDGYLAKIETDACISFLVLSAGQSTATLTGTIEMMDV